MDYNQNNYFYNKYEEYAKNDKTDKITFFKVFLLILSLVHYFVGYPYLKDIMRINLINFEKFSDKTIDYIMLGYLICSIAFIVITLWNICKTRYILKKLFIGCIIISLVAFGYYRYKNTHIVNNEVPYSFILETKNIYEMAKSQWTYDTKGFRRQMTYTKRNGKDCTLHLTVVVKDNINYSITLDEKGRVTNLIVTDGESQYIFNGKYLTDISDIDKNAKKVTNKIEIPQCYTDVIF